MIRENVINTISLDYLFQRHSNYIYLFMLEPALAAQSIIIVFYVAVSLQQTLLNSMIREFRAEL